MSPENNKPNSEKSGTEEQAVSSVGEVSSEQITSNEVQQLAQELDETKKEAAQLYDHLLRTRADLENYRKRMSKEKEEFAKFANENIIKEILPVLDDLELALKNKPPGLKESNSQPQPGEPAGLCQGVELIRRKLLETLKRFGLETVSAEGQAFNPALHEAVRTIETSAIEPDTVMEELRRGYLLNSRILRPAMVVVSKPAAK